MKTFVNPFDGVIPPSFIARSMDRQDHSLAYETIIQVEGYIKFARLVKNGTFSDSFLS
ncbi:MAG: hypothetical protein KDA80_13935 [Planctomycetaceae bacterium]|nr:hypothetical protein [Planctomycetaceae bacterium]